MPTVNKTVDKQEFLNAVRNGLDNIVTSKTMTEKESKGIFTSIETSVNYGEDKSIEMEKALRFVKESMPKGFQNDSKKNEQASRLEASIKRSLVKNSLEERESTDSRANQQTLIFRKPGKTLAEDVFNRNKPKGPSQ